MTYFKLGGHLFSKNPLLNGAIILQLAIAIVIFNYLIIHINIPYETASLLEDIHGEQAVYIQPSPVYRFGWMDEQVQSSQPGIEKSVVISDTSGTTQPSLHDLVRDLSQVERISQIRDYPVKNDDQDFMLRSYDSYLANKIKLPVTEGIWFSDATPEEGIVSVVALAGQGFKLGDIIDMEVYSVSSNDQIKSKFIRIKITGLLSISTFYLDFSSGGTPIYASDLFEKASQVSASPLLFCCEQDMTNYVDYAITQNNSLIFFEKGINDETLNKNIEIISTRSFRVDLIDDMIIGGKAIALKEVVAMLPIAIFIFAIGLSGLLSLLVLNTLLHRKIYAIYYICGCRWRDCMKVTSA